MTFVSFSDMATFSYRGNKKEDIASFCCLNGGKEPLCFIKVRCLILKAYDQKFRITEYS